MTSESETHAENVATWDSGQVSCTFYKVTDTSSGKVLRYCMMGCDSEDRSTDFIGTFSTSVTEPSAKGNVKELSLAIESSPVAVRRVVAACGWR